jgi:hypothetical protein
MECCLGFVIICVVPLIIFGFLGTIFSQIGSILIAGISVIKK